MINNDDDNKNLLIQQKKAITTMSATSYNTIDYDEFYGKIIIISILIKSTMN